MHLTVAVQYDFDLFDMDDSQSRDTESTDSTDRAALTEDKHLVT